MIEYMKEKSDCLFEGSLGMEMAVRPNDTGIDGDDKAKFAEPMWVFKKA